MSKFIKSAAYYRAYRAKNRERILAQEKTRRQKRTPEQIAKDNERKRRYREAHKVIGKAKCRRKSPLSHMTKDERAAHRYAIKREWREKNIDHVREYDRNYKKAHAKKSHYIPKPRRLLTDAEKKANKARRSWIYRQNNYQKCLENERERHRRNRDKTRKHEYLPCMKRRISIWAENPSHARYLEQRGIIRMSASITTFGNAIQSGLRVRRASV